MVLTWKYIIEMCALALFNRTSMLVINLSNSDSYFKGFSKVPRDIHDCKRCYITKDQFHRIEKMTVQIGWFLLRQKPAGALLVSNSKSDLKI